jgi:gluconokinase
MVVIVMGPAGAGKSTVGRALAADLGWTFVDADDLHAPASIEKMRGGLALTDDERWPWLRRVKARVDGLSDSGADVVLACSALRREYRSYLGAGSREVSVVFLDGPPALLASRLSRRTGHFAAAELLGSQLETLEPPSGGLTLDASLSVTQLVETIRESLTSDRQ